MDLEQALSSTHAHPETEDRKQFLRERIRSDRADFYAHLTTLKRYEAWEQENGPLPPHEEALEAAKGFEQSPLEPEGVKARSILGMIIGRQQAQDALDQLDLAIRLAISDLRALDPDASGL